MSRSGTIPNNNASENTDVLNKKWLLTICNKPLQIAKLASTTSPGIKDALSVSNTSETDSLMADLTRSSRGIDTFL